MLYFRYAWLKSFLALSILEANILCEYFLRIWTDSMSRMIKIHITNILALTKILNFAIPNNHSICLVVRTLVIQNNNFNTSVLLLDLSQFPGLIHLSCATLTMVKNLFIMHLRSFANMITGRIQKVSLPRIVSRLLHNIRILNWYSRTTKCKKSWLDII